MSVDGGMSDNPRPVLYGSGYEAFLPEGSPGATVSSVTIVGKHCESGDVLVRDASVPEDLRRRRPGHPGHRRLWAFDGVQLQQGAPAAGRVREGRPLAGRRPAGDLRRPPGPRQLDSLAPALPGQGALAASLPQSYEAIANCEATAQSMIATSRRESRACDTLRPGPPSGSACSAAATSGRALARLLLTDAERIAERTGLQLELATVAVRSATKERDVPGVERLLTTDAVGVVRDPLDRRRGRGHGGYLPRP